MQWMAYLATRGRPTAARSGQGGAARRVSTKAPFAAASGRAGARGCVVAGDKD